MATWKSTNIILTTKGKQLLSLLQNAEGSATITKVITGAGRVSEAELPNITEVENPKLPCSVIGKEAYDTGSILNLQVSNENLDATIGAYDVNQVGVYMRHPDIDGNKEFLYMIAQCDENTADRMPLPQVTPITLNYALYLLHGEGTEIEVTLDATAGVPMSIFVPVKDLAYELQGKINDVVMVQLDSQAQTLINHGDRLTILEGMEDLTPRVVTLENQMVEVNKKVTANETSISGILSRMSTAETNITSLQNTVKNHTSTLSSHTTSINGHNTRITKNASDIAALDEDLTVLEGEVDAIKGHPAQTDNPHNVTLAQIMGNSALAVSRGGTGRTSLTAKSVLLGNGTSAVSLVANAKGAFCSDGTNTPGFKTLPVSMGGTGLSSMTDGSILVGNGTSAVDGVRGKGALYATTEGSPNFGILPISCGGTGLEKVSYGSLLVGNSALNKWEPLPTNSVYGALYSYGNPYPMYGTLPVSCGGTGQTSISSKIYTSNNDAEVYRSYLIIPGTNFLIQWGKLKFNPGVLSGTEHTVILPHTFANTNYCLVISGQDDGWTDITKFKNQFNIKSTMTASSSAVADWIAIGVAS